LIWAYTRPGAGRQLDGENKQLSSLEERLALTESRETVPAGGSESLGVGPCECPWNAMPERLTHSGFIAIPPQPNQKGGKNKQDSGTVNERRFEVANGHNRMLSISFLSFISLVFNIYSFEALRSFGATHLPSSASAFGP